MATIIERILIVFLILGLIIWIVSDTINYNKAYNHCESLGYTGFSGLTFLSNDFKCVKLDNHISGHGTVKVYSGTFNVLEVGD